MLNDPASGIPSSRGDPGFAVYVHWPFCAAKCPYCDFNSHVRHGGVDAVGYTQALIAELEHTASRQPENQRRAARSIFFGGGTPSLMPPESVGEIIAAISGIWGLEPDAEITLEANPTSIDAGRFRGFHAAGVNRVSVGIQSLRDDQLKFLGRLHSRDDAIRALEIAQSVFPRVSFDLIYARPDQSVQDWRSELGEALKLAGEHLSLYQLTIEPDTPFARLHQAGRLVVPDNDQARDLYDVTQDMMLAAGMPAYEISNHARPGAECRHNLVYWRCGDFAGVGAGAHGRLTIGGVRYATATERMPEAWMQNVRMHGHGMVIDEPLDRQEQADEYLVMGLRLAGGIDPDRYTELAGAPLDPTRISELEEHGMVTTRTDGCLRVTPEGFPVLNSVVADLAS